MSKIKILVEEFEKIQYDAGLEEYKRPLEDAGYTDVQLAKNALEEAVDYNVYMGEINTTRPDIRELVEEAMKKCEELKEITAAIYLDLNKI